MPNGPTETLMAAVKFCRTARKTSLWDQAGKKVAYTSGAPSIDSGVFAVLAAMTGANWLTIGAFSAKVDSRSAALRATTRELDTASLKSSPKYAHQAELYPPPTLSAANLPEKSMCSKA